MNQRTNDDFEEGKLPELHSGTEFVDVPSAEELARLYAQTVGREPTGDSEIQAESIPPAAGEISAAFPPVAPEPSRQAIVEALLFVGDPSAPALSAERLIAIAGLASPAELEAVIGQLNARYEREGRPYRVFKTPEGYVLRLKEEFRPYVARLRRPVREARLSQAALEVLAIVAYRQPISVEEVSRLRGRPSGHLITQLVQRGLVQAVAEPGRTRPLLFRTTRLFEELFGLESLDDLPQVKKPEPGEDTSRSNAS